RQRLARRTYLQLKKTYTGTQLGIRLDLFRSIVRGERESMAALNRLIRVYYRPLCQEAQKKAGIVSARDVSCLFSNLPLIVKRFKAAYAMLLTLRERNWPAVTGLGTHFSNILSLFDLIVLHAANIQFINDTLESMLTTNPKFAAFSKKALLEHPGLGHFDFPTLLRWPLQHAQSLNARLEAYLAYTPETADFLAEREELQQVCDRLRSYSAQITRAEEGSTERARVLNIERQLSYETDGLDQALQLSADTHRYFVREGSIIYFDAKKKSSERHLFMFNDLLILAKGHAPSYHIGAADVLKLDAYSLMDNVDLEVELGLKGVKPEQFPVFKLVLESPTTPLDAARGGASSSSGGINPQSVGQTEPVFYLSAPSSAEKQVWFMKLKKQKQVNEQVFGVDLAELLANETVSDPDGIPKVVRFSCNQLQARGLLSVGLFRVSPDKSALNQMIREFNRGLIRTEESLAARDPAVMSEVLKVFFRSLPEPLMTYKLSETLARAENAIDPVPVLDALPPQNRTILDFLMNFLARV
ncbi:MAG TPA: RhoGAP domain-containing protein, partial [archaeon]|nr:RhoGAP domain-containing protein [archaeon]